MPSDKSGCCAACGNTDTRRIKCSKCESAFCIACIEAVCEGSINDTFYDALVTSSIVKNCSYTCHRCDPTLTFPKALLNSIRPSYVRIKEELLQLMERHRISQAAIHFGGPSSASSILKSTGLTEKVEEEVSTLSTGEKSGNKDETTFGVKKPTLPKPTAHQLEQQTSGGMDVATMLRILIEKEERDRAERAEERQLQRERDGALRAHFEEERNLLRAQLRAREEAEEKKERLRAEADERKEKLQAEQFKNLVGDKDSKFYKDPKNVPKFSGLQKDYLAWKSLFNIEVDGVKNMPADRKFFHLDQALKGGTAYAKLFGLHLHPAENYPKAMEKLKATYESKSVISQQLDKEIQELLPINEDFSNYGECLDKLTGLLDAVEAHKKLGYEVAFSPYGWVSKQPLSIQAELARLRINLWGVDDDAWTAERLIQILRSQRSVYQCYQTPKKAEEEVETHTLALNQTSKTDPVVKKRPKKKKTSFEKVESKPMKTEPKTDTTGSKQPAKADSHKELPSKKLPHWMQRNCCLCEASGHKAAYCAVYKTPATKKKRAEEKKLCLNCLSSRHETAKCENKLTCLVCSKRHHTALHMDRSQPQNVCISADDSSPEEEVGTDLHPIVMAQSSKADSVRISRQSKMIGFAGLILSPDESKSIRGGIYLDGGGAESFIRADVAKRLDLPVLEEKIKRLGVFANQDIEVPSKRVSLSIKSKNGYVMNLEAWTINEVSPDLVEAPLKLAEDDLAVIKGYDVLNPPSVKTQSMRVELLIGQDYINEILFASKHNFVRVNDGIVIHLTPLGNLISGCIKTQKSSINSPKLRQLQVNQSSLQDLEAIYQSHGVENEDAKLLMKAQDEKLIADFEAQLDFKDGHYYTELLWKDEGGPKIPSNVVGAYRRLARNVQHLNSRGGTEALVKYDKTFRDYENASPKMMETVPDANIHLEIKEFKAHMRRGEHTESDCSFCCSRQKHYLSHFAVYKEDSIATKMRVVLDGAEKVQPCGESLNDSQVKGPNFIQRLCGVICRGRVADGGVLAGDGEKAYNQIRLKESEKDRHRVMWLWDPTKPYLRDNVKVLRYIVLVFGLLCSSTILHLVLRYHIRKFAGELTDRCQVCYYVDNLWFPLRKGEDTESMYHRLKQLFLKGGFNIRHWSSSDEKFNQRLVELEDNHPDLGKKPLNFLGIAYDPQEDTIAMKPQRYSTQLPMRTKRQIVRIVAKYAWDALGLGLPVTMKARILIQKLWRDKVDWDELVEEERSMEMQEILEDLLRLPLIKFPRLILQNLDEPVNLIIFVDASEQAMAAVVYIWQELNERVSCNLVRACGKVAADKPKRTIVQLELNALLMGKRLALTVVEDTSIKVASIHMFSDSMIALHLCLTEKTIPKYSQLRVDEIMSPKSKPVIHHIDGSENPADSPSRGVSFEELDLDEWRYGPKFLHSSKPDEWTVFPESVTDDSILVQLNQIFAEAEAEDGKKVSWGRLNPVNFSSLNRLLNVTAWILRLVIPLRKDRPVYPWITAGERKKALLFLIRLDQSECYDEEISCLNKSKSSSRIQQLDLFLDSSGVLRCGGRICQAGVSFDQAHPPLLVKSSALTKLIVMHCHRLVGHLRSQATTAEVRRRFWLPGREKTIAQVLKSCAECRMIEGGRLKPPRLASLPITRLQADRAFQYVGCDHTGGIEVTTEGGGTAVVYILIFSCLVTRAVSLTLCTSTSAKDVLFAIRRFCSLRGRPEVIYSDNGSGFVKTKEELAKLQRSLGEYFAGELITWRLQKPQSPWANGAWERMVGTTKKILRHCIWKRKVSFTELSTVLQEIQGIINSRPLCQLDSDNGSMEVLMPIHFISPSSQVGLPYNLEEGEDPDFQIKSSASNLQSAFTRTNKMLSMAWQCFQDIYLSDLRAMQSSHHSKAKGEHPWKPKVDRVYLVKEENVNRQHWKRARVIRLLPSSDGAIRFVRLRMPSGRETERGVKDLYPLELQVDEEDESIHTCPSKPTSQPEPQPEPKQDSSTSSTTGGYNLRPRLTKPQTSQAQMFISRSIRPSRFLIVIITLLTLFGGTLAGEAELKDLNKLQICLQGAGGRILRLPEPQEICDFHRPRKELKERKVELFVPKTEFRSLPAILCYREETEACTSFGFFGGFGLTKPPTTIKSAISHSDCEKLNRTRRFQDKALVQHPILNNHFSTNLSLNIGYEWPNPNFCSKVENIVLEEGTVSSLDGSDVISSLGYAKDCNYLAGYCQRPDAVMIWQKDEAVAEHCGYISKGNYTADVNGDLVLIHAIQSAFHLRSKPIPTCLIRSDQHQGPINGTAEGAFIRLRRQIGRRSPALDEPDPNNPRIEYAMESLARSVEAMFLQQHLLYCRLAQDSLNAKIQMARVDPTVGARGLLNRTDVIGEWRGEHLIIHLCHQANVSKVYQDFRYGEDCYAMKPVKLENSNQIWFVAPAGLDLVPHSPKMSCDLTKETSEEWTPPTHSLLPLIAWNASLNLEPLSAPALFKSTIHYPASALRILAGDHANLAAQLHASIVYSSGFSYDTKAIVKVIETSGRAVAEFSARQWALSKEMVTTGIEQAGKVVETLASPITSILRNLLITAVILLILAGCAFIGYRWWTRPTRPPQQELVLGPPANPMRYLGRLGDALRRRRPQHEDAEETAL